MAAFVRSIGRFEIDRPLVKEFRDDLDYSRGGVAMNLRRVRGHRETISSTAANGRQCWSVSTELTTLLADR